MTTKKIIFHENFQEIWQNNSFNCQYHGFIQTQLQTVNTLQSAKVAEKKFKMQFTHFIHTVSNMADMHTNIINLSIL